MNLIKYEAFVKVSELGNITRVARELGYSQPGISHMLDSLEAEFGFPLLIRGKDSIRLTNDGMQILEYCKQVIENEAMLQNVVAEINGLVSGSINVGATSSTLVDFAVKLIHNFSASHSNIKIRIYENCITGLKNRLANGEIDVAISTDNIPDGFSFWPLLHDPACLIMHKDHPLASYDEVPIEALNDCDMIMPVPFWDDTPLLVQKVEPFQPNIIHYTASDTASIAMVNENMGVFIMSRLQCFNLPRHVVVRDFSVPVTRQIGVSAKPMKLQSPAVKEFVKSARRFAETYRPQNT